LADHGVTRRDILQEGRIELFSNHGSGRGNDDRLYHAERRRYSPILEQNPEADF
jgi:hypothetical protein